MNNLYKNFGIFTDFYYKTILNHSQEKYGKHKNKQRVSQLKDCISFLEISNNKFFLFLQIWRNFFQTPSSLTWLRFWYKSPAPTHGSQWTTPGLKSRGLQFDSVWTVTWTYRPPCRRWGWEFWLQCVPWTQSDWRTW